MEQGEVAVWPQALPDFLVRQYGILDPLKARIETHRLYTRGSELEPVVDAALNLGPGDRLLDIGTGTGAFPGRVIASGHRGFVAAVDLYSTPEFRIPFIRAHAAALPFDDEVFDAVTARHMLYHVADIPAALSEARRVLGHGGRFLAVSNTRDNMGGFWEVVARAAERYPPLESLCSSRGVLTFSDDNAGRLLRDAFGNVELSLLESYLELPDRDSVRRYFLSFMPGRSIDPVAALRAFSEVLEGVFPSSGPWVVSKRLVIATAVRR